MDTLAELLQPIEPDSPWYHPGQEITTESYLLHPDALNLKENLTQEEYDNYYQKFMRHSLQWKCIRAILPTLKQCSIAEYYGTMEPDQRALLPPILSKFTQLGLIIPWFCLNRDCPCEGEFKSINSDFFLGKCNTIPMDFIIKK